MFFLARSLARLVLIVGLVPLPAAAQALAAADGGCSYDRVENLTFPSQARAQALPFANLSGRIKRGNAVTLLDADGGCTEGRVIELTPTSLTLLVKEADRRTFPEGTVQRIIVRDSLWNGAMIGFAAGVIPVAVAVGITEVFVRGLCRCDEPQIDRSSYFKPLAIGGGIGALIGLGIDAAMERTINVSGPQRARLMISPVITTSRQSVLVSIRF